MRAPRAEPPRCTRRPRAEKQAQSASCFARARWLTSAMAAVGDLCTSLHSRITRAPSVPSWRKAVQTKVRKQVRARAHAWRAGAGARASASRGRDRRAGASLLTATRHGVNKPSLPRTQTRPTPAPRATSQTGKISRICWRSTHPRRRSPKPRATRQRENLRRAGWPNVLLRLPLPRRAAVASLGSSRTLAAARDVPGLPQRAASCCV